MFLQTPKINVLSPEPELRPETSGKAKLHNDIQTDENVATLQDSSPSHLGVVAEEDSENIDPISRSSTFLTETGNDTDGYDTDLENSNNQSDRAEQKRSSAQIENYIHECNKLGAIPASYFQRHIDDKRFVMRYYGLGPTGAKAIARPLETNTSIEVLDLEGNCISAEGVAHLVKSLKENVYITVLDLSDNDLGSKGAKIICESLKTNQLVKQLSLSRNNFRDSDGEHFHDLLVENKVLEKLVLRHNHFEFVAVKWLKKAMQENVTLQTLDLSWNNIHLQGATYIAELVKENYGLRSLDLKMNGLGNTGAAALGAALKYNNCLTDLNIACNRINNQGVMQFAKGLVVNETLEILELRGNPIDHNGAFALLCAIGNNSHLKLQLLDLTNIMVKENFQKLLNQINDKNESSLLRVLHAGLYEDKFSLSLTDEDPRDTFERDPMTKLKRFAEKQKLRLVDLFRQFDREQKWSLDFETLQTGIKSTGIKLDEKDIKKLMVMLGQDKDGKVYYREFLYGDKSNRAERRQILREVNEDKIRQEEMKQKNIIKEFQFKEETT